MTYSYEIAMTAQNNQPVATRTLNISVTTREADGFHCGERLEELNEEFVSLTAQVHQLEVRIAQNFATLVVFL